MTTDRRSEYDNGRHPDRIRPEPEGSEPPMPMTLRRDLDRRRRDDEEEGSY